MYAASPTEWTSPHGPLRLTRRMLDQPLRSSPSNALLTRVGEPRAHRRAAGGAAGVWGAHLHEGRGRRDQGAHCAAPAGRHERASSHAMPAQPTVYLAVITTAMERYGFILEPSAHDGHQRHSFICVCSMRASSRHFHDDQRADFRAFSRIAATKVRGGSAEGSRGGWQGRGDADYHQ